MPGPTLLLAGLEVRFRKDKLKEGIPAIRFFMNKYSCNRIDIIDL